MHERFGELVRRLRRKADKTLGEIADEIGVSVVYLSDVERGNRKPFGNGRIIKLAMALGQDAAELITAADFERGFVEYDLSQARPLEAGVVGGLIAGLSRGGISDGQLEKIQEILDEGKRQKK